MDQKYRSVFELSLHNLPASGRIAGYAAVPFLEHMLGPLATTGIVAGANLAATKTAPAYALW